MNGKVVSKARTKKPYLFADMVSDTAWKKNPPADYFYPPHDIFGYLASVKANLQADKYANEYGTKSNFGTAGALAD